MTNKETLPTDNFANTVFVNFSFDEESKSFPPGSWIEIEVGAPPPGVTKATLGIVGALGREYESRPVREWPEVAYTSMTKPTAPCAVVRHRLEYPGTF